MIFQFSMRRHYCGRWNLTNTLTKNSVWGVSDWHSSLMFNLRINIWLSQASLLYYLLHFYASKECRVLNICSLLDDLQFRHIHIFSHLKWVYSWPVHILFLFIFKKNKYWYYVEDRIISLKFRAFINRILISDGIGKTCCYKIFTQIKCCWPQNQRHLIE